MRFRMDHFQPVEVASTSSLGDRVLPCEWRVSHDAVEPAVGALEHLGEFDLPVERLDRVPAVPECSLFRVRPMEPGVLVIVEEAEVFLAFLQPLFFFLGGEERGDSQVASEPDWPDRFICEF